MSRTEDLIYVLKENENMLMRSSELTNVMLIEIAKSLAVIADKMTEKKGENNELV